MNAKKLSALILSGALTAGLLSGCGSSSTPSTSSPAASSPAASAPAAEAETAIALSAEGITVDGQAAGFEQAAVYLSNDIIYYEDRETYDSGNPYGEGSESERHSAEDAAAHTVVNITAPGTYRLSGQLPLGQIRVDLGEDAAEDPSAVVTLILDGADITCEVAPAILFLNVYECDTNWSTETATFQVDTTAAGANLILADGSQNTATGSHVARIYKDNEEEKKLWKQDAAVYSYMSMNVDGTGTLEIVADNEGLDTELHMTINGGNLNIFAQNDGINTNEDGVSVTTINGGNLHIVAGLGEEGDGIDSNGWLVINGGTVIASANPAADAGLDSDMGSYINGGTVVALGSTMDWAESDSNQVTMNLQFADYKDSDSAIVVTKEDGSYIFAYDPSDDEVLGGYTRRYMGAILSSPAFALGDTYQVFIGGTLTGSETAGVYDTASITAYEGGVQQGYTGTDVMMRPGGMGGGRFDFNGEMPELPEGEVPQTPDGELPERPEGDMFQGQRPEGGMTQMPDGQMPQMPDGQMPEMPEGQMPEMSQGQRPEGGMTQMPGGFTENEDGSFTLDEVQSNFYMQDKVNAFSGLTDL